MTKHIHGGDVYKYDHCLDFSANCNPLIFTSTSFVIYVNLFSVSRNYLFKPYISVFLII